MNYQKKIETDEGLVKLMKEMFCVECTRKVNYLEKECIEEINSKHKEIDGRGNDDLSKNTMDRNDICARRVSFKKTFDNIKLMGSNSPLSRVISFTNDFVKRLCGLHHYIIEEEKENEYQEEDD